MKKIKLPKGYYAICDDEDYPYLNRFTWLVSNKGHEKGKIYALMCKQRNKKQTGIAMHELVIDLDNSDAVSFKNGNSLDVRKENLISVDKSLMLQRSIKRRIHNATSKYKGLTYRKKKDVWEVRIAKDKITHFIGSFKSERKAAQAYNIKAVELYGELAYQNKVR
jgi:hypothetical protein